MQSLGEKIRHLRDERRWSQRQLAKEAGLTHPVVQRIENPGGARPAKRPAADSIAKIARALGVTTDELLELPIADSDQARLQRTLAAIDQDTAGLPEEGRDKVREIVREYHARSVEERRRVAEDRPGYGAEKAAG